MAWAAADRVFDDEDDEDDEGDEAPPAPVLVKLHNLLTSIYPCLSSYPRDGMVMEDCPWSDGPLINNFSSQSAILGLSRSPDSADAQSLIVAASVTLGLTVLDEQTEVIHRPHIYGPEKTFSVSIHAIERGRDPDRVKADVARTFKVDQDRLRSIFSGQPYKVKHGLDYLTALRYHATLRKLGCKSAIDPEQPPA